ncbi:MAG: branched-chain amino acid ABC transporter permease [Pseudomonadota bacterium]|nr:branched-chain amino acid ABC transporter permease [Pseudomonadota bacterium]
MSFAWQYYLITVLVYFGVNLIAAWALNLQFGYGGVLNFAFVMFQALGAYVAAVLSLGPAAASGGYQRYVLGASLPWPLPLLFGCLAGAALAAVVGWFSLKPARRDFQAVVMLVISLIAYQVVGSQASLFNGAAGVAGVPKPLLGNGSLLGWGWLYVGVVGAFCAAVYACIHNVTGSPWGRRLRAMRDNPAASRALGTNVGRESLKAYVLGGGLAALSGGLLVEFIGAWSPGSWSTGETFVYFVALVVGGLGNNFGALVGTALVLGVFTEGVRFLPNFSLGSDGEAIQALAISVLILVVLWLRPVGLVPERRRRLAARAHQSRDTARNPDSNRDTPARPIASTLLGRRRS